MTRVRSDASRKELAQSLGSLNLDRSCVRTTILEEDDEGEEENVAMAKAAISVGLGDC